MKRFLPALLCLCVGLAFLPFTIGSSTSGNLNTYPNLPAPIAKEKILITSAGQAVEAAALMSIAENLNLEADYRPRALSSDLYEYQSIVMVVGYSKNGLSQTLRNYREESDRVKEMVREAKASSIPIILVDISGVLREDQKTWKLLEEIIPYSTYFIGFKHSRRTDELQNMLRENDVPTTLVYQINEIEVPFNSAYR